MFRANTMTQAITCLTQRIRWAYIPQLSINLVDPCNQQSTHVHAYNYIISYLTSPLSLSCTKKSFWVFFFFLSYCIHSFLLYKEIHIFFVTFIHEYNNNITSFLISLCSKFDGSNMINNIVAEIKDFKENSVQQEISWTRLCSSLGIMEIDYGDVKHQEVKTSEKVIPWN